MGALRSWKKPCIVPALTKFAAVTVGLARFEYSVKGRVKIVPIEPRTAGRWGGGHKKTPAQSGPGRVRPAAVKMGKADCQRVAQDRMALGAQK